jgi:tetratricopeptide (TPR) repeat protein
LVKKLNLKGDKPEGEAVLTASPGVLSSLRRYLHNLFHLRALHRDLDNNTLWGEEGRQEQGAKVPVLPLDIDRIQEIISEEEQQTDHRPIFLSDLIPKEKVLEVDSVIEGGKGPSQGLIDAERHFFRSLKDYEAAFEQDSFPLVDILYRFAKLFISRGQHDRAVSYLQKAWSISQKADKQSEPIAGIILVHLVEASHRCKNMFESDKGFYSLLEVTEQRGALQTPELGEALNRLANYFVSCGENNKATLIFDRALNVFFFNQQEDHSVYINVLNSSGSMYYGLQVFPEAHRLYELAIRSIEKHDLYTDSNTPILYHNSGLVCCHINRMTEARTRLVRSLITALQNGQEWVLWKSCYSLSYLFFQENTLSGALFFGKLALAITLQSWQGRLDDAPLAIDPFLAEHMENLFQTMGRESEWEEVQEVFSQFIQVPSEGKFEDSLQFFSGEEKTQFQVFLLLSLKVKQVSLSALTEPGISPSQHQNRPGNQMEELEVGFLRLLSRWDSKKKGRLSL